MGPLNDSFPVALLWSSDVISVSGRLEQLETALRQSDYERVIFSERVGQEQGS